MLFKDLSKPFKLERVEIFKITNKNINKNNIGIKVKREMLLDIKNI